MFSKFKACMVGLVAALVLTGCGRSTVPPAALGKVLSTSGYSADVKQTGKYWLLWWENMVVLDTSTQTISEPVTVKMLDDLDLTFRVNFRTRIDGSEGVINAMFNDIKHENYQVTLPMVYRVYGRDVVSNVARSVVGKYRVKDVSANYDKINSDLQAAIREAMKSSPLEVSNVTVGGIVWPKVVTEAIEKQQERELAIQTEANNQAVLMVQKENELALAEKDYEIRMTKARAIRDENKTTAEGLNPMLLAYRALEVQEKMAENNNAVFVPYGAIGDVGLNTRIFAK